MEHVRCLSNDAVAVGFRLGLPASVSLPHKHGSLELRRTDAGPRHTPELDVDEQISQTAGSLYTASGGPSLIARVNHLWLFTRANQG